MSRPAFNLLAVSVLACFGLSTTAGMARPVQVPPVGSDALEHRCDFEGGSFEKHRDGTYLCRFPNGKTVSCNPDGLCIEYFRPQGGGRGAPILESPNGDVMSR